MANTSENSISKKSLVFTIIKVVVVLALISLPAFYFYTKYTQTKKLLADPQVQSRNELNEIKEKVARLYKLPEGEEPTLATVSNIDNLKDQDFFDRAENGDKVLIFSSAKRAVLYRPSIDKIIEIAPVIGDLSQNESQNQPSQNELSLVIVNGTSDTNSTYKASTILDEQGVFFTVDGRGDASKLDYAQTLVIDLTGQNTGMAEQIAGMLGAQVSTVPEGENKPDADILIITGSNLLQ